MMPSPLWITQAMTSTPRRSSTQPRRKDRRLEDDAWLDRFLSRAPFGHLAVCHEDGPHLHSNLFWYDGEAVWLHTAPAGRLLDLVRAGAARACFTVAEHGRILPSYTPLEFSTEYASVLVYGHLEVVTDLATKRRGLEGLMTKYAPHLVPGVDYTPMPDKDVARTAVFRLAVTERVGKHNIKPDDCPAYPFPGESFIDAERAAGRITVKPGGGD
ncbi:MAG TPA: pyridoxamine 5'-phosphate oxidase family protein [Gemmatimonadales bacterium]|nr:pyridoxamine 5'-phosphate oxidase family protein [Gemmatimonadales bacterium]